MKVLACKEFTHIIAWTPSGLAFDILKPRAFTKEVLPVHFKTAKYSSFIRKLHRWGFVKHYHDKHEESGTFCHKNFQSGRLDLAETIRPAARNPPQSKTHSKTRKSPKKIKGPVKTVSMPGKVGDMVRLSTLAPSIIHPAASIAPLPAGRLGNSNAIVNVRVDLELQRLLAECDNASAWPSIPVPHQVDYSGQVGTATASWDIAIVREVDRRIKERFDEVDFKNRALTSRQEHLLGQEGYNLQKNASTDINAVIEAEVDRRLKSHLQGNIPSHPRQQQHSNPFAFHGMYSMPLTPLQQYLQSQSGTQDAMLPFQQQQQLLSLSLTNPHHVGTVNKNAYEQHDGSAMSALAARRNELLLSMFPLSF